MRCYCATPRYEGWDYHLRMHAAGGLRNALLSFANWKDADHAFRFWIERRAQMAAAMMAYFAGTAATSDRQEAQDHGDGVRHRLLSYADIAQLEGQKRWVPHGRKPAEFWIERREEVMKLYIAGNGKSNGSSQRDHDAGAENRLLSYAFKDDWAKQEFQFWIEHPPQEVSVFLDSGAFSAHTLGRKIDLGQYCEYVQEHRAALAAYAVLDVIGDAAATEANLREMRRRGLDPVAIYHVGATRLEVLERVLSEHTGYVALGGMASDRPTREELQRKLDRCWKIIERHWPVKVHGLGVMAQWALERYPFYSVDSASAIMGAGMGRVQRWRKGRLEADGWAADARRTHDGEGMDFISVRSAPKGSAHEGRRIRNIQAQLKLERYVTDLWTQRGVTWDS